MNLAVEQVKTAPETKPEVEGEDTGTAGQLVACVVGLQVSYLCWGYVQEKVMTKQYDSGELFPSALFCVFSNRVLAIVVAMSLMQYQQGSIWIEAPLMAFAPASISNTVSSFGQYNALHYVSFPLQTLAKSTKLIPVMLMGKLLNHKTYQWVEYAEAVAVSFGVTVFALASKKHASAVEASGGLAMLGLLMLGLYILGDSFTSQYQSRVYKAHPNVNQFQMMFATNVWSACFTMISMLAAGELSVTLAFISRNPEALLDNIGIAITSASGQLFIFYTIRKFGPVVFTLIMTTRQMLSIGLSSFVFGHNLSLTGGLGMAIVFATLFYRMRRNYLGKQRDSNLEVKPAPKNPQDIGMMELQEVRVERPSFREERNQEEQKRLMST